MTHSEIYIMAKETLQYLHQKSPTMRVLLLKNQDFRIIRDVWQRRRRDVPLSSSRPSQPLVGSCPPWEVSRGLNVWITFIFNFSSKCWEKNLGSQPWDISGNSTIWWLGNDHNEKSKIEINWLPPVYLHFFRCGSISSTYPRASLSWRYFRISILSSSALTNVEKTLWLPTWR